VSYSPVELESEAELEDKLFTDPSIIEPGMRSLARQWNSDRGPLDLLLLDRDGRVVVAELKLGEDDGMLMQGVDYLGWVHENLVAIQRAFEKDVPIATDQPPRLILIAKAFSDLLRRRAAYLREDVQPTLLAYRAIEHQAETLVVLTEIEPSEVTEPAAGPTRETDLREYLVGDDLRGLWDHLIEALKAIDPQVATHSTTGYLAIGIRGRNFASVSPRRHKVVLGTLSGSGRWEYSEIPSGAQIQSAVERAAQALRLLVDAK
jgi:hypothetical protein